MKGLLILELRKHSHGYLWLLFMAIITVNLNSELLYLNPELSVSRSLSVHQSIDSDIYEYAISLQQKYKQAIRALVQNVDC